MKIDYRIEHDMGTTSRLEVFQSLDAELEDLLETGDYLVKFHDNAHCNAFILHAPFYLDKEEMAADNGLELEQMRKFHKDEPDWVEPIVQELEAELLKYDKATGDYAPFSPLYTSFFENGRD